MNNDQILNQILSILHSVKEDKTRLEKILAFLVDEIYEEPGDETFIPEKYQTLIRHVADSIDAGLICFINPETFEVEEAPQGLIDPEEFEMTTGEKWDDSFKHKDWSKCITVEPPESGDSFNIMAQFTNEVADKRLQSRLIYALNHKRPFANFKGIVETSVLRKKWFSFKKNKLEEHVWNEIQFQFLTI